MKNKIINRIIVTLLALFCVTSVSYSQNATYIYRNDGQFHAFFNNDIDSIVYSNVDTLGIHHNDFVVQEIYALDSIFRIPLTAIDSISFHAPAPILQPDVRIMNSEWSSFVISIDNNTITFNRNIPNTLMPKVGDVLVTEFPNTDFPSQFSGRVEKIQNSPSGIECTCSEVELTDIYKRLVLVGKASTQSESSTRSIGRRNAPELSHTITIDREKIKKKFEVNIDEVSLYLDFDPQTVELQYSVLVEENKETVNWIRATQITTTTVGFDFTWETKTKDSAPWISKKGELNNILKKLKVPVEVPVFTGVTAFVEVRPCVEPKADVSLGLKWSFTSTTIDDVYRDANDNIIHNSIKNEFKPEQPQVQASIEGEVFVGVGIRVGIGGIKRQITSIGLDVKAGGVLSGDAHFEFSPFGDYDTSLYSAFKDTKVALGWRLEFIPFLTILTFSTEDLWNDTQTEETRNPLKLTLGNQLWEWYLFPEFNEWVSQTTGETVSLQIDASRRLLWPAARVGIEVFDELDRVVGEHFEEYNWGTSQKHLSDNFTLHKGYAYDCYPIIQVKWGDNYLGKIKAAPSKRIVIDAPVVVTGDHSSESATSAVIKLSFGSMPSGSVCGYTLNGTFHSLGYVNRSVDVTLTGLSPDTEYEYNAYAFVEGVPYSGVPNKFKTLGPLPITGQHYDETLYGATIVLKYENVPDGAECGYFLDKEAEGTSASISQNVPIGTIKGEKIVKLTNLEPDTKYYYQAYIKYEGKTYWNPSADDEKEFRTLSPIATTGDLVSSTTTSAEVMVTFENVPDEAECAVSYYCNDENFQIEDKRLGKVEGEISVLLENLLPGKEYHYIAYIKYKDKAYEGIEKTFKTQSIPVELSDFMVTKAEWKRNGYEYNGKTYTFKYNCSVTATLTDATNVKDWGYCYVDPDGDYVLVSLLDKGTSYKDTHYAYCRNEPEASVILYGYVWYNGEENPQYAEGWEYPVTYEEEPSISFESAEITSIDAEPKYDGSGNYLFTWYTAGMRYVIKINGGYWIDYIQPIIYDNGSWSNNGGKTRVPGDGLYSVNTNLSYDNEANMNWSTGYRITLTDGSIIYTTNEIVVGGTPEQPTVSISTPYASAKKLSKKVMEVNSQSIETYLPQFGELEFIIQ